MSTVVNHKSIHPKFRSILNQIKISLLSIKYALQREMLNKFTFFSNIIFMVLNNACFIVQWIILYAIKEDVGGYSFKQVLLLWGLAAGGYGISHFFFKESFKLSDNINSGKLDNYLIQPKNVLLSLITSNVEVSALGDLLYGIILLFFYGFNIKVLLLFILFSITSGLIITSIAVITGSFSFWFGKSDVFADTVNGLMTNFATYPEGIFNGIIKTLFYTIIPLGFSIYLPIQIMSCFNLFNTIVVILITIFLVILAFIVFYRGLRKYSSTNLMNVRT